MWLQVRQGFMAESVAPGVSLRALPKIMDGVPLSWWCTKELSSWLDRTGGDARAYIENQILEFEAARPTYKSIGPSPLLRLTTKGMSRTQFPDGVRKLEAPTVSRGQE